MAVKRCPQCGDLYLAAVDRCVECDVALLEVVESAGAPPESTDTAATGDGPADHLTWELHSWTMEGRRLLDGMLDTAGFSRAWQGTTLVAPAAHGDDIDEMVAVVAHGDARVGVDDCDLAIADAPAPGDDVIGYEVAGWDRDELDRLVERLERAGVAFGWDDDGDLVVNAADESRVDAVFGDLADDDGAGEDEVDEADGLVVQETLSDLFIAVDRLRKHPLDGASAQLLFDANDRAADLAVPFGFPPETWATIVERGEALAARFEPGTLDDEAIQTDAAALRALLRDYV